MKNRWMGWAVAVAFVVTLRGTAQMGAMPIDAGLKKASLPSTGLTLTIAGKDTMFSVADLKAMPQKTVTAHNQHTKAEETYTGVGLSDVLAKCGFAVGNATHQSMLHSYLRAEGTDKYWVLYSVTEVEGSEHLGDVLIALEMNGKPLGADGELKLIASGDKKPERWVRNLASVALVTIP